MLRPLDAVEEATSCLTISEVNQFDECGWIGPYQLLDSETVERLAELGREAQKHFRYAANLSETVLQENSWFKSLHVHYPDFCRLAAHPQIVGRLKPLLGENILAWGLTMTTRRSSQRHRWHVDLEHSRWHGLTVFIGLENVSLGSSLTVVSGSHKIMRLPQLENIASDLDALDACRSKDPRCELHTMDMRDGQFFIFHGRLWHASRNTTALTRTSVIAQYCSPDADTRIPLCYDEPVIWSTLRPASILVSGIDRVCRNLVVREPAMNFVPGPDVPEPSSLG